MFWGLLKVLILSVSTHMMFSALIVASLFKPSHTFWIVSVIFSRLLHVPDLPGSFKLTFSEEFVLYNNDFSSQSSLSSLDIVPSKSSENVLKLFHATFIFLSTFDEIKVTSALGWLISISINSINSFLQYQY